MNRKSCKGDHPIQLFLWPKPGAGSCAIVFAVKNLDLGLLLTVYEKESGFGPAPYGVSKGELSELTEAGMGNRP